MLRVSVKPDLLRWAIERSGKGDEELKKKFPKLQEWLEEKREPTIRQLESFARATHTALGYFFLPEPPVETLPIPDFRMIAGAQPEKPSAELLDTIYLCQQRQAWYSDYARLYHEEPVDFVGSVNLGDEVQKVAAAIRRRIGFDLEARARMRTWEEALRQLIALIEQTGVLVMISGVVGSNTHRALDPEEFRGFALADEYAPLIFVNGKDSKAAQMFTLVHELAHLWLGESGVSDAMAAVYPDQDTERWCNAVAAEVLAPLHAVREAYEPARNLQESLQCLARRFKVSTLVVLRRLHDAGFMEKEEMWRAYQEELERLKEMSRRQGGGGDFYNTMGARVSKRFASALIASTLEGQTTFTEAFRLLSIRSARTFFEEARRLGVEP